jgi:formylglycine-generating enzyme required for sulfatase activity/tRNA A-37 threonylcarbamoyl transferase component Bud32
LGGEFLASSFKIDIKSKLSIINRGDRQMLWTPGKELQKGYRIESILGQGGFGIAYKATHLQLNHQVVIKTPNSDLQNDPEYPKFIERFKKEGQILARLGSNHNPAIVRVSDLFEEEGIYCLVMDLIVGESLWDIVQKKGALSEEKALPIIRQIGEALIIVHQAGIIHRDAHPGNILLRNNGAAVLIDFGIAAEILPTGCVNSSMHPAHQVFAPYEQFVEGSGKPSVDVYCLASSLYYVITGKLPTPALKRKLGNASLDAPKQLVRISDRVNNAILKGMALEPQNRPQTMQEFVLLLQQQNPKPKPDLSTFSFEIVKVNAQGKIISRQPSQAQYFTENLGNGIIIEMVYIPGGTFLMGSPQGEGYDSEQPQHKVTIQPFYMAKYPITQEQYQAIMGTNPSGFKGAKRPVEQVSWDDSVKLCQKLSQKTGKTYHLPSEAQWEYACRAGTTTPFYFGETITPDLVNYDGNNPYGNAPKGKYREQTTDVGSFPPNAFGLYDMHGNVWEWCQDAWHDNYNGVPTDGSSWETKVESNNRVLRGGSWLYDAVYCRGAYRNCNSVGDWDGYRSFRVAIAFDLRASSSSVSSL